MHSFIDIYSIRIYCWWFKEKCHTHPIFGVFIIAHKGMDASPRDFVENTFYSLFSYPQLKRTLNHSYSPGGSFFPRHPYSTTNQTLIIHTGLIRVAVIVLRFLSELFFEVNADCNIVTNISCPTMITNKVLQEMASPS